MSQSLLTARLEGLKHENREVRSVMLSLFATLENPPHEAADHAIEVIEEHGWEDAFHFSHLITQLPHSPPSASWVGSQIVQCSHEEDLAAANETFHLLRWLAETPPHVLSACLDLHLDWEKAREDPFYFDASPLKPFESGAKRVIYREWSEQERLEELDRQIESAFDSDEFPHYEVVRMKDLAATISPDAIPPETLISWLAIDCDPERVAGVEDFRAGAALIFLQTWKHEVPANPVINLLRLDWDWLNELIPGVLAASGSLKTFAEVVPLYPDLPWEGRLFLTGYFERLGKPECEEGILSMLEGEEADDLRVMLAHAAAVCGTEKAKSAAESIVNEFPEDPERSTVADILRADEVLLGVNEEETARWLNGKKEERKRMREHQNNLTQLFEQSRPSLTRATPAPSKPRKKRRDLPEPKPAAPNPHPGVGRNDPCPCGSGKKYKKCCWGKA